MSTHGNEPQDPYGQQPEGQPPYGDQPGTPPPYGQPQQPQYGQPQYGQPQSGEPQYGQAPYGEQPAYGQVPPPGGYGYGGGGGGGEFSVGAAFAYGWEKFKANAGLLLTIAAAGLVGAAILSGIGSALQPDTVTFDDAGNISTGTGFSMASSLFNLLSTAVSILTQILLVKAALNITRTGTTGDLFAGIPWLQVIVAWLLIAIGTGVGTILCIVPGIVFAFFTFFTQFFILDKNLGAIDALKASFELIKANASTLFVFALASVGVYILGFIACCIGLVVALPVAAIAQAYAFRTIQGEPVAP